MRKSVFYFALVVSMALMNCDDLGTNFAQKGNWIATNITRSNCTNQALNGTLFCSYNLNTNDSCIRLNLGQSGYTLKTNFDIQPDNETGTYETGDGIIKLCPTSPQGFCYNLTIITSDIENMIVSLPRSGGCVVTAEMVRI